MIKSLKIGFLLFYSFGTFCLPMGNFSMLPDLPEMYAHCKVDEDRDMMFFDFITDHVLNLDGIFDKHQNGDEQKPHTPSQNHHITTLVLYQLTRPIDFKFTVQYFFKNKKTFFERQNILKSDFNVFVFHPPMIV